MKNAIMPEIIITAVIIIKSFGVRLIIFPMAEAIPVLALFIL